MMTVVTLVVLAAAPPPDAPAKAQVELAHSVGPNGSGPERAALLRVEIERLRIEREDYVAYAPSWVCVGLGGLVIAATATRTLSFGHHAPAEFALGGGALGIGALGLGLNLSLALELDEKMRALQTEQSALEQRPPNTRHDGPPVPPSLRLAFRF